MALKLFLFTAALVAQQCSAVPMSLPSSLLPSFTFSGIPIPTGAHLDLPPPGRRDEEDLVPPPFLPTLTGFSLPPLPTFSPGGVQKRDEENLVPPPFLPTLTGLPTGLLPPLPTLSPAGGAEPTPASP